MEQPRGNSRKEKRLQQLPSNATKKLGNFLCAKKKKRLTKRGNKKECTSVSVRLFLEAQRKNTYTARVSIVRLPIRRRGARGRGGGSIRPNDPHALVGGRAIPATPLRLPRTVAAARTVIGAGIFMCAQGGAVIEDGNWSDWIWGMAKNALSPAWPKVSTSLNY